VIEQGLWHLLSTTAAITALCGTRIYPVILPPSVQPIYPFMTYQVIVAPQQPTMDTAGMQHWRLQFDCWGETYLDAAALRTALVKTLSGAQQTLSDGTVLQNARLHTLSDDFASASRTYRCIVDISLDFNFNS
jgi:hypothetical protein